VDVVDGDAEPSRCDGCGHPPDAERVHLGVVPVEGERSFERCRDVVGIRGDIQ
jgi:hypothetical protein